MQIARSVFRINRKCKLSLTLDLHENRPEIMRYYTHVNTFPGKFLINPDRWKKFEYKYIKKADKVIVVTKEAKNYYLEEIPTDQEKFHVVPNSVRPAFYSDYKEDESITRKYEDNYTILYIGETGLRRGLETAIKSLEYLIPVIPNVKIVFVGESKTDPMLKRLVREKQWNDYVEFTGWQDFQLFQSYILASDIGICPIHRNLHHDTTYANKIFQYLSLGKPIIVSDSTAQKNLAEEYQCGLVFRDREVKDFAEKVISLYRDREYYNQLSANAEKAIKENLNWDILSRELITLYSEISTRP
jgi:glycosyltransferase involved in cell wall biosynthesis